MTDHELQDLPEDDYLWDPSAPTDEAVAELEAQLRPLAFDRPAPAFDAPEPKTETSLPRGWWLAAAAALLVLGWALSRSTPDEPPVAQIPTPSASLAAPAPTPEPAPPAPVVAEEGWELAVVGGAPTCDGEVVDEQSQLRPGVWLETNADARAQLKVAELGTVEVGVDTRLRIVSTSADKHVVELTRGTAFVTLDAPPERFVTKTRFGDVVDLGCRYVATVDDERLTVEVTAGAIALRRPDGEVRVDEGFGVTATLESLGPVRSLDTPAPPPTPSPAPVWNAPPQWTPDDAVPPPSPRGRERSPE